jgi:thioredoxin reductase (NADPH)
MNTIHDVIIIGSGPAGLTAAVYAARANLKPIVLHGPLPGGQLTTTTEVENFPGFEKGIMGPELMDEMRKQAERFGAQVIQESINEIDLSHRPFTLKSDTQTFQTKSLIIATGATAKTLGLPNEWELMGYGVSTCATCDGAFFRNREIVVVGGGDSACEEAMFLTKFGVRVRMIHRREELRASKIMAERTLKNPKIEVVWNSELVEILGTKAGGVTGAVLQNTKTGEKTTIECAAIFYGIGHTPTSELFRGLIDMDENGYLKTVPNSTYTNIEGVFACGDIQDHVYRQAITAAGSGCMAAIDAERWLSEHE